MRTSYRFFADGEAVMLSTSYVSLALTARTPIEQPESGSVSGVVPRFDQIGIDVTHVAEEVTGRAARPYEAETLGVPQRHTAGMPFPDEPFADRVCVLRYQNNWTTEGADLAVRLRLLVPDAIAVDHIGSTAVPGMPAKDCIDAMVQVRSLDDTDFRALVAEGFRERPEPWNHEETLDAAKYPKRVFAPPQGGRPVNIHFREAGSRTARYSLLFRDYLREDSVSRAAWGQFKIRLAETATDINSYGQIKSTVQPLLMTLAEQWAADTSWRPGLVDPSRE